MSWASCWLDYQWGKHSLYGTGGFTKGLIDTPNSWGPDNPFNSRLDFVGRYVQDMNPYGALGDTIVRCSMKLWRILRQRCPVSRPCSWRYF